MNNQFIYKNFIPDHGEEILKIIRQAKGPLIAGLTMPVLLIVIPFFLLFTLFRQGTAGIAIFFTLLAIGLIWLTHNLIIWYFKVLLVTNRRIVDIDQQKLFHRVVSEVPMAKIQDVFYRIRGFGQTISRVGDVQIVLTDNKTRIEVENVFQPHKIQQLIIRSRLENMEENLKNTQVSTQELLNLVKRIKDGIGEEKLLEIIDDHKK